MEFDRVANVQDCLLEIFPDLPSGPSTAIAQDVVTHLNAHRARGTDAYFCVAATIENLCPRAFAPILSYQAAALYVMDGDRLWLETFGEAPAGGDPR